MRKIYIKGKRYDNVRQAALEFKIPAYSVIARVRSTHPLWKDWTNEKPRRKQKSKDANE